MQIALNVDSVEELVLSPENAPGIHKTIRQIQILECPKRHCMGLKLLCC